MSFPVLSLPIKRFLSISFFSFLFIAGATAQTYTWYQDLDGDGWGNPLVLQISATQPAGYVLNNLDCDDSSANGSKWVDLGTPKMYPNGGINPDIAIGGDGVKHVIFKDYVNGAHRISSRKYSNKWDSVGNAGLTPTAVIGDIANAVADDGTPYIFYQKNKSTTEAKVVKYDGTQWGYVGSLELAGLFGRGNITTYNNEPYIVCRDGDNGGKATVLKFSNNKWSTIGSKGFSPSDVEKLTIVVDKNGTIYISYVNTTNKNAIVMKYTGSQWVTLGSPFNVGPSSKYASVAVDNNSVPYIVFHDENNNGKATVKKFVNNSWVNVGSPVSSGLSYNVSIVIDNTNTPYVLYEDETLPTPWSVVKKFNGNNWVPAATVDSAVYPSSVAVPAEIALDTNGVPFVAMHSSTGTVVRYLAPDGGGGTTGPSQPTALGTPTTINAGDSTVLKVTAGTLNDATDWIWYTGSCGGTKATLSTNTANGATVSVKPTTTTTYYVRGEGGCLPAGTCDSVTVVVKTTSINTLAGDAKNISLYPNPNNGVFTVMGTFAKCKEATIMVLNSIGQKMYNTSTKVSNGQLIYELTMPANTPLGMYLLSIEVDGHVYHKRFNIE